MKVKLRMADVSLRIKVPFLICMALAILVGGSSLFLYRYYYKTSSETVRHSMESSIRINQSEITSLLDTLILAVNVVNDNEEACYTRNTQKLSNIATQIVTYKALADQSDLYDNIQRLKTNQQTFGDLFQIALHPTEEVFHVALLVTDEYPIFHLLPSCTEFAETRSVIAKSRKAEELDWYKKAVQLKGENYWFCQEEYPDVFFLVKQLRYKFMPNLTDYYERQLGVIVVGINMDWIRKRMENGELTSGTQVYIADTNGNILFSAGDNLIEEEKVIERMEKATETLEYKEFDDVTYLVQKNDIGHGLCLMTAIPTYDIENLTFQMVRMILIVMVVVIIFGILMMTILGRWLFNPVIKLSRQMEKGNVKCISYSYEGKDEIGILYQSYNSMQKKIQELIKQVWEQAEKQKNAQIHALQMQINPHFVFNTLSAVGSLALINGQDEIAEQLKLLSEIMRYNTRNPDALVTLQTEIVMIKKYEEIQRFSFESCFEFNYDIDPECENIMIPKLIIQPLVENTIIHSRDQRGEGSVTVTARFDNDESLVIRVADDGMDVDVEKINRYIKGESAFATDKESFGIRNVYERLKLIYADNGNLEYRHTIDKKTEAVITIKTK